MKLLRKYLLPCLIMIFIFVFGLCSCKTEKNPSDPTNPDTPNPPVNPSDPTNPDTPGTDISLSYDYVNPSIMPYYAEWLDKQYPRPNNVEVKKKD